MTTASTKVPKPGTFRSALANRDYRWLLTGLTVSTVGSWAYNVALIVFVFEQTGSATWLAATSLARFVPSLLFAPYGGVLAERIERRSLMIRLDLVATGVMTGLALLSGAKGPVVIALILAGSATMLGSVYFPATAAMTPQVVGEDDLAAANSLNGLVENTAVIAGPALGAALLLVFDPEIAFVVNALTFVFSAYASARVTTRSEPIDVSEGGTASVLKQIAVGFRAISSSSTAAVLVAFSVVASFFYGCDTVLFAVISDGPLDTGAAGFGYLLAALGVGGIIASTFVNKLASSPRLAQIISVALILYVLPTALFVVVTDPFIAGLIQVVRGGGTLVVDVLAVTAIQRSLPSDLIARVFGVFMSLVLAAISLGALVTSILLNVSSLDTTLLVLGIGATALVIVAYPLTLSIDRATSSRLEELSGSIEVLESVGIFSSASRTAVERLAAAAVEVTFESGEPIITEGEDSDSFYVISNGAVAVSAMGNGTEPVFIREMGPGEAFGEIGLLQKSPRTASIESVGTTTLYRIAGEEFINALTDAPLSTAFVEGARGRLALTHPNHDWVDAAD